MQTSSIIVSLAGDTNNQVVKHGMTVPEVLVLMAGHGQHSVTLIPGTFEEGRGISHVEEIARLTRAYDVESVKKCFGEATFGAKLPTRFFDIGLSPDEGETDDEDEKDEKETPTAKKKRIAADKAHAALLADAKEPVAGSEPPAETHAHAGENLALVD